MFKEEKANILKEKDQLLTKKTAVKEEVTKELLSVQGLA